MGSGIVLSIIGCLVVFLVSILLGVVSTKLPSAPPSHDLQPSLQIVLIVHWKKKKTHQVDIPVIYDHLYNGKNGVDE